MTELGERAHLLSREIGLKTHVADIVGLLRSEDLSDVVLAGHSYGGTVIPPPMSWSGWQRRSGSRSSSA